MPIPISTTTIFDFLLEPPKGHGTSSNHRKSIDTSTTNTMGLQYNTDFAGDNSDVDTGTAALVQALTDRDDYRLLMRRVWAKRLRRAEEYKQRIDSYDQVHILSLFHLISSSRNGAKLTFSKT
jgi:hypothetical protein